ncbi:MAG: hypothetical protein M3X11_07465 [Acidobacteriota bacterium]|nr:hypothetical protein [Acidobacteriota bacterium]
MATSEYQLIAQQALALPAEEQLRLIQQLAEKLSRSQKQARPRYLVYGEFCDTPGREFSTEEDFKLAEWHPTEEELNGE